MNNQVNFLDIKDISFDDMIDFSEYTEGPTLVSTDSNEEEKEMDKPIDDDFDEYTEVKKIITDKIKEKISNAVDEYDEYDIYGNPITNPYSYPCDDIYNNDPYDYYDVYDYSTYNPLNNFKDYILGEYKNVEIELEKKYNEFMIAKHKMLESFHKMKALQSTGMIQPGNVNIEDTTTYNDVLKLNNMFNKENKIG